MTETKNMMWKSETRKAWVVREQTGTYWQLTFGGNHLDLHNDHVEVLREYFRDERDRELGRWRHPDYPDYYVKEVGRDHVEVTYEVHNIWQDVGRSESYGASEDFVEVARAYFDAHPEKEPWHDAKEGEVWVVDFETGITEAVVVPPSGWDKGLAVVTARRIWPESKET